jgi:glycosyltransferase involved in cell wall biosynthesis
MNSAPRVLLSATALAQPMGGVRRQAVELLPRVARRLIEAGGGLDLLISALGLPRELDERLPPAVGRILTSVPPTGPVVRALFEGRAVRAAAASARSRGTPYDLFHTGHLPAARVELPLSFLIHDLRDLTHHAAAWRRLVARRMLPRTFERARAVLTVSETMRAELTAHFPAAEERIFVIPHGGDHLPIRPRTPGPLLPDQRSPDAPILFLGHLEHRRNPMLLIETLARHPELPPVVFAGAPKQGEDLRLRARARELGILGRVFFLGPVPESDLPWLYSTAGCLVIPSRIEGFGIPALEAQRAGLPLAASRAGALPEVTAPGTPLFDAEDPESCARALQEALGAPQHHLQRARDHADQFRWETSAEGLFEIWSSG